ncbi:hypothetical protein SAMN05443637_111153 [Pseudonocardia thermophila]|jgi:hypothetical protein|uniref:Uncharacterized protein n=1 Tax=Pseudonocardia thermophila TaxID=1848 RepID=A0A1M6V2I3_PSETH|nr:hypothetical protein [Pseudonocardia thermophila]SHK75565.1 hypothetical protein SAMN05443637_111153 [Pseudonocardia thermophila]
MTTTTPPLAEVIERIDRIRDEALTVPPGGDDPGRWRALRDRALAELTAGLPDVDCAVCIAGAPPIPVAHAPDLAAEARSRLLTWLARTAEQLRLGRAVAESMHHETGHHKTGHRDSGHHTDRVPG